MVHSDQQNSGAAWLENNGKTPSGFRVHFLANRAPGTRGSFHSLALADFDEDGLGQDSAGAEDRAHHFRSAALLDCFS
jgi:hypothetical protein